MTVSKTVKVESPETTKPATLQVARSIPELKIPDLRYEEQAFINALSADSPFRKDFIEYCETHKFVDHLKCLDEFLKLEHMVTGSNTSNCLVQFPKRLHESTFMIPNQLAPLFILFYAAFFGVNAKYYIDLGDDLGQKIYSEVASSGTRQMALSVFYHATQYMLDSMFKIAFFSFVRRQGGFIPSLHEGTHLLESENSLARSKALVESQQNKRKTSVHVFEALQRVSVNMKNVLFTKEDFCSVMMDEQLYAQLRAFGDADFSGESFQFVEETRKLEERLMQIPSVKIVRETKSHLPPYIARFLYSKDLKKKTEVFIPVPLVQNYVKVFDKFISPKAELEVNINSQQKKKVTEMLSNSNRVPISVFDDATDAVMLLIYQNTFKRFVDSRHK